jgi:hypothetical protein
MNSSRSAKFGTAAVSALALFPAALTLAVSAPASAAVPTAVDVCSQAVAPGYATCFAEKSLAAHPMTGTPSGYGPTDLQSAYNLPSSTGGSGQTVYIVDAYDDPSAESDLAVYRSTFGLPSCTTANGCFAKLNQSGSASPLPASNSGWAGEISLDVDMVSAICPKCSIRLIEASNNGGGLYTAVQTAVNLGAKFVSMSWGGGEFSGETSYDSTFSAPGVLFAASTGDNAYQAGVSYPAASANVLAVGGTSLTRASNGRGWSESVWGTNASEGAGSGCSAYESKPSWQNAAFSNSVCPRRADSDVSAEADPNTGVAVYYGGWGVYGGTSASAPIVSSIYALAGTPGSSDNPASYPYSHNSALYDVTSGNNGSCGGSILCAAATGWDGPTGLGTPNGIGAFSASGSGTPVISTLSGSMSDASEVPGLPANVSVTATVPTGQTLSSVAWTAARPDCSFGNPAATSTTVTCSPTATGTTKLTATLTDSAGDTKAVQGTLSFTTSGDKRAVTVAMSVDGQSGSSASVCTGNSAPVTAVALDSATGAPLRGLSVTFSRKAGTATSFSPSGTATTSDNGSATKAFGTTAAVTYQVQTAASGVYAASSAVSMPVTVAQCTPSLSAEASTSTAWYNGTVTVTGRVTRPNPSGTGTLPVDNLSVPVAITPVSTSAVHRLVAPRPVVVASALTHADGSFSASFKATASGEMTVTIGGTAGFTTATADLGALTVNLPTTTISGAQSSDSILYGDKTTVSGTLASVTDSTAGVGSVAVYVKLTPNGSSTATAIGTAHTAPDGSFSVAVAPSVTGTLSVVFNGVPGQPAASATVGSITVGTWTPSVSLAGTSASVTRGQVVTYSGTVTRTAGDVTGYARGVLVKLVLTPAAGGAPIQLGSVTTNASGAYSVRSTPRVSGTVSAVIAGVVGYTDAASDPVAISVG